jgi:hypothetical protein
MPATIGGPFECAWRCFLSYWGVGVLVCGFSAKSCHDFFFVLNLSYTRPLWGNPLGHEKGIGMTKHEARELVALAGAMIQGFKA